MKKKILFIISLLFILFIPLSYSTSVIEIDNGIHTINKHHEKQENPFQINSLNLEKGDIVWRWVDENFFPLFQYFMHPLMFTGNIDGDLYEFVESHGGKDVCLTTLPEYRIKDQGIFRYGHRLKEEYRTPELINNVINFATASDRLDDEFVSIFYFDEEGYLQYHDKNYDPYDSSDPLSDKWYCTELIWAAYYNQGINLDMNDGPILSIDLQINPYVERIIIY